ncbi:MAG: hypothetical protein AB1765_07420 [Candidatus Hydrogenedentota bacterium]
MFVMKDKYNLILFTFYFLLFTSSCLYAVNLPDTWANIPKKLSGNFTGTWADTDMYGPDVYPADTGYWYRVLKLIPGSQFQFKFKIDPDSDGQNYLFEPDFSTNSGNREITVTDNGSGTMNVFCNWADTPGTPLNLNALSDSGSASLYWDTPSFNDGYDVAYGGWYNIYYCTGAAGPGWVKANPNTETVTNTYYKVNNLMNDTVYYFYVRAYDAYGVASDTSNIDSCIPVSKVNITFRVYVGEMIDSAVYLGMDTGSWQEILLSQEGSTNYWSETLVLSSNLFIEYKFVIVDTANDKQYEYPVAQTIRYMFIYPDTTGLSQVQVQGSWNDWGTKTDLTEDEDGYWRGEVNLDPGQYEYKFILNGSNYVFDPYNQYQRNNNSLLAIDCLPSNSYMREFTVPQSDTIINVDWEDTPLTPPNFIANPYNNSSVRLQWTQVSSSEDIDSYILYYTETPWDTSTWIKITEIESDMNYYYHTNLIMGDTYYYRIYSRDYGGNTSVWPNFESATVASGIAVYFKVENREELNLEARSKRQEAR